MKFYKTCLAVAAIAALSFQASAQGGYGSGNSYTVTLTNITKGISFTPFLAATHNRHQMMFNIGEAASQNLINIAEGGDISGMNEEFEASSSVFSTASTAGLLGPGASVSFDIESRGVFKQLSILSMLLPTNDTFTALSGAKLPKRKNRPVTYYMKSYDAGSEMNTEYCADIPGPHCGGSPFSPEDEGEGYIYPSPGIHGEADLSRAQYNWSDPVIKVVIQRN